MNKCMHFCHELGYLVITCFCHETSFVAFMSVVGLVSTQTFTLDIHDLTLTLRRYLNNKLAAEASAWCLISSARLQSAQWFYWYFRRVGIESLGGVPPNLFLFGTELTYFWRPWLDPIWPLGSLSSSTKLKFASKIIPKLASDNFESETNVVFWIPSKCFNVFTFFRFSLWQSFGNVRHWELPPCPQRLWCLHTKHLQEPAGGWGGFCWCYSCMCREAAQGTQGIWSMLIAGGSCWYGEWKILKT